MSDYKLKLTICRTGDKQKSVEVPFENVEKLNGAILKADQLLDSDQTPNTGLKRTADFGPALNYNSEIKSPDGSSYKVSISANVHAHKNPTLVPEFAREMIGWVFHKTNQILIGKSNQ